MLESTFNSWSTKYVHKNSIKSKAEKEESKKTNQQAQEETIQVVCTNAAISPDSIRFFGSVG